MKMNHYFLLGCVALFSASCKQAPDSDQAETTAEQQVAETPSETAVQINTESSTIKWIGTKVTAHHVGTINIKSGEINVSDGQVSGGQMVLDMSTLAVVGPEGSDAEMNEKLRGHMMSPDFFDVENHPEATFEITGVTLHEGTMAEEEADPRQDEINAYKVANPSHMVSGNLTIRGETRNITFPAMLAVNTNGQVDVTAKFNIDRNEWGISYPGKPDDLIRDQVHLGISVSTHPAQTAGL